MSEASFPVIKNYGRVAIDTETTGVGKRDVPVGISYALPDGAAGYLRWGHQEGGNNTTLRRVQEWARDQFQGYRGRVIFHESLFDLRMLDNVTLPLFEWGIDIHDTKFMAALINELTRSFSLGPLLNTYNTQLQKDDEELNEKIRERFTKPKGSGPRWEAGFYHVVPGTDVELYAISDAVGTLTLHDIYDPLLTQRDLQGVYDLERSLIPTLSHMYRHGVRVDVERAAQERDRIVKEIEGNLVEWEEMTGGIPLSGEGSRKQLYELWKKLELPFETTRKGNMSINAVAIQKAKPLHPFPRLLETLRKRERMVTNFLEGYIINQNVDGRLHSTFHPLKTDDYGTVSGRFSSSDPNLQNPYSPGNDDPDDDPKDQYGQLFRSLFLPEEWGQWASLDYSQIEYRLFAHYAGGRVLKAYQEDPDVDFHQMTADLAGIPRKPAKNLNFAKLFGAGVKKVANMLSLTFEREVSYDEALQFIINYDKKIPEAKNMIDLVKMRAEKRGYIKTIGGRRRRFRRRGGKTIGSHAALNALVQGGAADVMKQAMADLAREVVDWENVILHLTVHDEVDMTIPRGAAGDRVLRDAREVMANAVKLSLPILVGVEVGENWGHLTEWSET